jgi:hypothetical protein
LGKRMRNDAELEIELFCCGVRIDPSAKIDDLLSARTRAGLGSGLDMTIGKHRKKRYVNVPVKEKFAGSSPYRLMKMGYDFVIADDRDPHIRYFAEIPPLPSWYQKKTSSGKLMSRVGVMQGTYLGIYIGEVCKFWKTTPSGACKFCTTGVNVGTNEDTEKKIEDVVETALAAKVESGITFVHLNSGEQENGGLETAAPYVKALKERVGILVGVQVTPTKELWKYDWLIDLGVDHFSFCYEFQNPEYFKKYCPGKAEAFGQDTFFRAMEYVSKKMGKGRNSGEIIAGIEPVQDTLKAIDYITGVGCFPTVCIFRPLAGAELEDYKSPRYEDMVVVMRRVYESCMKNSIPVGLAPNIEVSLIVNPDDALELVPFSIRKMRYEFHRKSLKVLAYPLFLSKMRKRKISADPFDPSPYKP